MAFEKAVVQVQSHELTSCACWTFCQTCGVVLVRSTLTFATAKFRVVPQIVWLFLAWIYVALLTFRSLLHRQDAGNCSACVPPRERPQCDLSEPAPELRRKLPVHAGCQQQAQLQVMHPPSPALGNFLFFLSFLLLACLVFEMDPTCNPTEHA